MSGYCQTNPPIIRPKWQFYTNVPLEDFYGSGYIRHTETTITASASSAGPIVGFGGIELLMRQQASRAVTWLLDTNNPHGFGTNSYVDWIGPGNLSMGFWPNVQPDNNGVVSMTQAHTDYLAHVVGQWATNGIDTNYPGWGLLWAISDNHLETIQVRAVPIPNIGVTTRQDVVDFMQYVVGERDSENVPNWKWWEYGLSEIEIRDGLEVPRFEVKSATGDYTYAETKTLGVHDDDYNLRGTLWSPDSGETGTVQGTIREWDWPPAATRRNQYSTHVNLHFHLVITNGSGNL